MIAPIQGRFPRDPKAGASLLGLVRDLVRDYATDGLAIASYTANLTSGSKTVTNLPAGHTLKPGEGFFSQHGGPLCACNPPTGLTVTPTGTVGTTTYEYAVCSLDGNGGASAVVTATTTTGNATLSVTNYNAVSWTAPTTGTTPSGYALWVKDGTGAWTYVQTLYPTGTTSFQDTGYYVPNPSYLPSELYGDGPLSHDSAPSM